MSKVLHTPDNLPRFMRKQYEFTAHIRAPEQHAKPTDVEDRRMAIYRDLFYNNVESFISSGFPVLRSLYDDTDWHSLVRGFFSQHQCQTPYFLEISQEFLYYLQHEHSAAPADPPFLLELAHYEWVELALNVAEESLLDTPHDPNGDLLEDQPLVSQLAWPLQYQYDVHHISPDYRPQSPPEQATYLIVYRDRHDDVHFMEVNAVTVRLLQLITERPDDSGRTLLGIIATELNHPDQDVVIQGGRDILNNLKSKDIILGTRTQQR